MAAQILSVLTLAALAMHSSQVQAQSGGFTNSCSNIISALNPNGCSGFCIAADCINDSGHEVGTAYFPLDDCFANYGGNLVFAHGGGFSGSCKSFSLGIETDSGITLYASCGNGHGGYQSDSVNLNNYLGNTNGYIVC